MGILKGRNAGNSSWTTASVVWAWVTGSPSPVKTYAKKMEVRNATNTAWERAWTDCRQHDAAGGRDWSEPVDVITYTGTCNGRTQTTTTTRTKFGCPDDVRAVTVASPNCTDCYDAATVTEEYYDGSCDTRRLRTKTVTNPKSGSGCGSSTTYGAPYDSSDCNSTCYDAVTTAEVYYDGFCAGRRLRTQTTTPHKSTNNCTNTVTYGAPYASPTCDGGCTTSNTADFVGPNGYTYYYDGVPGNFVAFIGYPDASGGCDACPPGQFRIAYYTVTTCNGTRTITPTNCGTCQDFG
jgi:hypothetical protein